MRHHPIERFKVGHRHGLWYVRDTLTGRARGCHDKADALHAARRGNRLGTLHARHEVTP